MPEIKPEHEQTSNGNSKLMADTLHPIASPSGLAQRTATWQLFLGARRSEALVELMKPFDGSDHVHVS